MEANQFLNPRSKPEILTVCQEWNCWLWHLLIDSLERVIGETVPCPKRNTSMEGRNNWVCCGGIYAKDNLWAYGQGFPAHVFPVWLKIIGALALVGLLGDGSHCIASGPVTASWILSVLSNEWTDGQLRWDVMRRCERQGIKMTSTTPGT